MGVFACPHYSIAESKGPEFSGRYFDNVKRIAVYKFDGPGVRDVSGITPVLNKKILETLINEFRGIGDIPIFLGSYAQEEKFLDDTLIFVFSISVNRTPSGQNLASLTLQMRRNHTGGLVTAIPNFNYSYIFNASASEEDITYEVTKGVHFLTAHLPSYLGCSNQTVLKCRLGPEPYSTAEK